MYSCYIIQSQKTKKFYIGITDDVIRRVRQHNEGISKWTKNRGPWNLVWGKSFPDSGSARKFENLLKRQKGGNGFYLMTGLNKTGS